MLSLEEDKFFERQIVKLAKDRIIGVYLEGIILLRLRAQELSGYDLVKVVNADFKVLISPGTMYATIYSLERQGFIESGISGRKKVYRLSSTGKAGLQIISESTELRNLLFRITKEFFPEKYVQFLMKLAMETIKKPLKVS